MTTTEFVKQVVLLSEGKLPTFTTGTPKWERIVAQGNFYLRQLAFEMGIDWHFFYDPSYSIGTASGTAYELDDDVQKLSSQEGDQVLITTADVVVGFDVVPANRLNEHRNRNVVAKVGREIRFSRPIQDTLIGGAITAPVYLYPEPFSNPNAEIEPQEATSWLVLATAADRVKNDVTRKDLRADLVGQANNAMSTLMEQNDGQINQAYKGWSPTGHIGEW